MIKRLKVFRISSCHLLLTTYYLLPATIYFLLSSSYLLLATCCFLLYTFYFLPTIAFAQEMSSPNFRIQGGNLNMTSGNKASQNFNLSDVVGQTASSLFSSKGYLIQSGFLNSVAGSLFSLSIYPAVVDFGTLIPNSPVEKTLQITISNGDVPGYSISVAEDHELSTLAQATITNTSCNLTNQPCTINKALRWDDAGGIYGFGFNLAGNSVARDFTDKSFYRPFANLNLKESPAQIMVSQQKRVIDQAIMTLKLNISPEQAVGQYRNTLSFTAVAGI